jgi:hypothetical protein
LLSIYVSISNLFFGELTVSEQQWSCCIGVDSLVLGDLYASNQTSYMRAWQNPNVQIENYHHLIEI